MKVLLCEDDDCQLKFLENVLVPRGFDVCSTQQGDEALHKYKKYGSENWLWVITDFQFGRGEIIQDGLQLVHYIRRLNPQQNCLIQTSEKFLPLPFGVRFLHKPFLPNTLLRMLREPVRPLLPLQ